MIITKIRIQEEHPMAGPSATWPLPVCDLELNVMAGENGYIVQAVEGLGPPDFTAVVEGFDATGIPVMTSEPLKRDIALRISIQPGFGQSYGELRDDLYRLISRTVFVQLMSGAIVLAQATGFINKFETVLFSSLPELQMTIECQEGAFAAPKAVNIPLATLNTAQPIISYEDGSAPTGMDLQFTCTAAQASFSITEHSKFWAVGGQDVHNVFTVTYPFLAGDVVKISTQTRKKRVTVTRGATTTDLAGRLNPGAVWPRLFAGVNTFHWTMASSWMTWNSASYIPRYWGV